MTVLIAGADGQLGYELQRSAPSGTKLVLTDYRDCDITDETAIANAVRDCSPAFVINAAAYTAVDKAEQDADQAFAVNATGAKNIALACAGAGVPLVQVSTDYVFDGTSARPYEPGFSTAPRSVYGSSKLAGEKAVRELLPKKHLILRTAWVYSAHGHNFVKTMLRLMRAGQSLSVVADQLGSPTWAATLAETIWALAPRYADGRTMHCTDSGVASWYDFAKAISEEALAMGMISRVADVSPIPTRDYPTPAERPMVAVLDKSSTWQAMGSAAPHWRESLRRMLQQMKEQGL